MISKGAYFSSTLVIFLSLHVLLFILLNLHVLIYYSYICDMSELGIYIILFFAFLIGLVIFRQYWKEITSAPTDKEVACELREIADLLEQEKPKDN